MEPSNVVTLYPRSLISKPTQGPATKALVTVPPIYSAWPERLYISKKQTIASDSPNVKLVNGQILNPDEDVTMEFSREELNSKLEANQARLESVETRIESRLARIDANQRETALKAESDLRAFASRVEIQLAYTAKTSTVVASVFLAALSVLGLCLAVVSYGSDRFDGGVGAMSSVVGEMNDVKSRQLQTERSIAELQRQTRDHYEDLSKKLDTLIKPDAKL